MKKISYILFFILLIFIAFPKKGFSQNALQNQFDLAENLYKEGKYFDAITEFKRLIFFDFDSSYYFKSNEMIGECYKMGAKFSDAILYYTYAEMNARNQKELFDSKINIIRSNILRRTTDRALQLLNSLSKEKQSSNKKDEINYWKGWAYIFADDWESAGKYFSQIDSTKELAALCRKVHDKKYSVLFAKIISHIIPGSGQIYTGNYFSGLLSLGWNLLWGYTAIRAFIDNRVFDGFAVTNFLWLRFYNGNLQNAEKFAKEKNLKISNKALNFLQYKYNGLKP